MDDEWSAPPVCRCPFADFDDPVKCCRTDMPREQAEARFEATFGRKPEENDLPARLRANTVEGNSP